VVKPSIVVANDDPVYLDLIKELLIDEGYSGAQYIQGPAAFNLIQQVRPDLVLLDLNIANSSVGWKTLDLLRLHPDTTHIPIILCSTDGHMLKAKADWLRSMRCDTLEKPFDLATLLEKVVSILGPPPQQADKLGS
jgi:two-component system, sensor histidine kinase ChiS